MKVNLLILLSAFIFSGCTTRLTQDTYKYTLDGNSKDTQTAFFILSNINLTQSKIEKIEEDYKNETVSSKKFLYEFLLAKRTQEQHYALRFIKSSESNHPTLLHNNSNWVSVANPTLELLSFYSKTNNDALGVLLKLLFKSDGASQSVIASNLRDVYELQPTRFIAVTKKMEFEISDVLLIMEGD